MFRMKLKLQHVGYELVPEGDLVKSPGTILAVGSFVGLFAPPKSGSALFADIESFAASAFTEHNHRAWRDRCEANVIFQGNVATKFQQT